MPALETPVAAASPTPAPSPTPSPSPSPAPAQPSGSDDPFERKLQSTLGADVSDPNPTPEPQPKPAEVKKPEPKPAAVAPAKPTATPIEKPPAVAKPADEYEPKGTAPELRVELKRMHGELKSRDARQAEMEAKIKEADEKGKNTDALESKLKEHETESKRLKAELSAARFETSEDYKNKFEKPFVKLYTKTKAHINSLLRTDGANADFDRDFGAVLQASANDAPRIARELFGEDHAIDILGRRRQMLELQEEANEAVASERTNWETNKKKADEAAQLEKMKSAQQRETDAKNFQQINEDLKNSVDDYRDPADDAELATARAEAASLYHSQPRSKEEHMVKLAHIQHRLGAYGAQKLQIARATARIAELEAKLEETKTRQPGADPQRPGGGAIEHKEESFDDLVASGKWKTT